MRMVGLLLALALIPQDPQNALREYVTGESSTCPDVSALDWQQARKTIEGYSFPAPENPGKESSHSHKLSNGHEATFYYYVPSSYDPAKPTPLAFFLHGGVSDRTPKRGKGQWQVWKSEADQHGWIACSPSGTNQCLWWEASGEEHILEAVRFLSARYNIDRNRVVMSGFSDGASGAYCIGMRLTDVWGACIPWNGAIGVVTSPRAGNTPFYTVNARGVAWRATHGSKDTLYPSDSQKPFMDRMKEAGVGLEWKNFEGIGHDGGKIIRGDREFIDEWLPKQKRNPLPKEIDWSLHDERYGQAYWIRVLQVADRPGNPFEAEKNFTLPVGESGPPRPVLGVQIDQNYPGPGVKIESVNDGSGAQETGVQPGDVVASANGSELKSFDDLRAVLSKAKSGEKIKLSLTRGDQKLELDVPFRPIERKGPPPKEVKPARIRAVRDGNAIKVQTCRIGRFEILVSPDAFDLAQDLVVTVNDKERFKGRFKPDVKVMLDEMRRRHGDTSVVYVAKIDVDLPLNEREY